MSLSAAAVDLHFDYMPFDNPNTPGANPHFGQAQFNVLNYPSINGNYMMTSTDTHRPEMGQQQRTGGVLQQLFGRLQHAVRAERGRRGRRSRCDQPIHASELDQGPRPHG